MRAARRYPRQWLLALVVILFARTTVHVRVHRSVLRMPVLVAMALVALFIWFAENVATWAGAWSSPRPRRTGLEARITAAPPAALDGRLVPDVFGARAQQIPIGSRGRGPPGPLPLAANPQPSATERP